MTSSSPPSVERHEVAGIRAEVDDVADAPSTATEPAGTGAPGGLEVDLLGAHGVRSRGARRPGRATAPVEHVGGAHEAGHERGRGSLVDLRGGAHLLDAAPVEDGDPVAHGERLVLVVGDVDERDAQLRLDGLELQLHLLAQLEVERAEWLVEEQHPGSVRRCARASATRCRWPPDSWPGLRAPYPSSRTMRSASSTRDPSLVLAHLPDHQAIAHVVRDGHVREQRVVLEHGVDVAVVGRQARHVLAVEQDPAGRGQLEPGDHAQGRGLARAGRTEHREELAGPDVEVDAGDRRDIAVQLADALEPHRGRGRAGAARWCAQGDRGLGGDGHALLVAQGPPWPLPASSASEGGGKGDAPIGRVSRRPR